MQKIMFNEKYGLQKAVFEEKKTQTRREPFYYNNDIDWFFTENGKIIVVDEKTREIIYKSRYAAGEIVAIAERYNDSMQDGSISSFDKGWWNKMFVKADLMPHHIKITYIRCERLQDISNEDCMKEGVFLTAKGYYYIGNGETKFYFAKQGFKYIICKLNGKKFWNTNPYVIVYEFEKID